MGAGRSRGSSPIAGQQAVPGSLAHDLPGVRYFAALDHCDGYGGDSDKAKAEVARTLPAIKTWLAHDMVVADMTSGGPGHLHRILEFASDGQAQCPWLSLLDGCNSLLKTKGDVTPEAESGPLEAQQQLVLSFMDACQTLQKRVEEEVCSDAEENLMLSKMQDKLKVGLVTCSFQLLEKVQLLVGRYAGHLQTAIHSLGQVACGAAAGKPWAEGQAA